MKFCITMKDPDGVFDSVTDHILKELNLNAASLTNREIKNLTETRRDAIDESLTKWFRHGEYLTVEVDLEAGTCTVVPT